MKINDRNILGTAAAEAGRAQEAQRAGRNDAAQSGATDPNGDRVELSSTMGRLSRAISSFNSQRASRVEALAAQYQSGNYRVDAKATSRAMVGEALSVGGQ